MMNPLIQQRQRTLIFLSGIVFACFGFLTPVQAVVPAPDGCYPNYTTAEGCNALKALTIGLGNTGVGWYSLFSNTDAGFNTGVGAGALALNNGDSNTAVGTAALLLNGSGGGNVAIGYFALSSNTTAGFPPSDGTSNAIGYQALQNSNGQDNNAVGFQALQNNVTGNLNNAFGWKALQNCTGGANTAIGDGAGRNATTGNFNVYIGASMTGVAGESDHTYIRNIQNTPVSGGGTDTVTVNLTTGLIGHLSSSRRYKENIKPMKNTSETLYRLKPVTYRYKKEIDPSQSLDYGLVAEDVAKVDPNLADRNRDGQIEGVRYNAINAMLLNEFLKEHGTVQKQQKEIDTLKAELKEQKTLIQKVSAQLELTKAAPRTVKNND